MTILNRIEAKIGSVHNWPQDILRYLFYIRRQTHSMIVAIIKFLFCNKISLDDALDLFDVYSNLSPQCEDLVHKYYEIWSRNKKKTNEHLLKYEYRSYGIHKRIRSQSVGTC